MLKMGWNKAECVLLCLNFKRKHTQLEPMSGFLTISLRLFLSNHVFSHLGLANSPHVSYLVASFGAVLWNAPQNTRPLVPPAQEQQRLGRRENHPERLLAEEEGARER